MKATARPAMVLVIEQEMERKLLSDMLKDAQVRLLTRLNVITDQRSKDGNASFTPDDLSEARNMLVWCEEMRRVFRSCALILSAEIDD